jgi:hypothetical protein
MPREAEPMPRLNDTEERRAAALRENLRRRKRQARERASAPELGENPALVRPQADDRKS